MKNGLMARRRRAVVLMALAGALLLAACGGTTLPAGKYTPSAGALPNFSHIFVIVMENHEYGDIIGSDDAKYINTLARTYGLTTHYYATTHPSLPNYLSLVGGDTFGVTSDCTDCFVRAPNLVDALEAGHKTWRAYMEDMPAPCFVGDAYPYMQKHDPFIYFDDVRTNPARCRNIVPLTELASDLSAGAVPNLAWITPNMCHDMHDCPTATGDQWLAQEVPQILASPAWKQGGALFITWDEGVSSDGCCAFASGGQVVTLVISPLGKPHFQSATPHDHYGLLRTITDAWGLSEPGRSGDPATTPLTEFFNPAP